MIMQQNEIERSRCHYTLTTKQSTTVIRRQRIKSGVSNKNDVPNAQSSSAPIKFNISSVLPPLVLAPSITNVSKQSDQTQSSNAVTAKPTGSSANSTYLSLTEATLAEHDRLHGTVPVYHSTKRETLVKWTQELALCGRLSPREMSIDSIDDNTNSQSPKPRSNAKEISSRTFPGDSPR